MPTQDEVIRTTFSINAETYRALVELARRNERSAAAEARVALKQHLERSNDERRAAVA